MEQEKLNRYLLRDLPEAEREIIEKKYLNDSLFFDELMLAEGELIDSYAAGELSPEIVRKFEEIYLTNQTLRKKVEVVRALYDYSGQQSQGATIGRQRYWRYAIPAVAALLVFAILALFVENRQLEDELLAVKVQKQTLQQQQEGWQSKSQAQVQEIDRLLAELEQQKTQSVIEPDEPRKTEVPVLAFLITPELLRGGTSTQVLEPASWAKVIQLDLLGPRSGFSRYRASLQTVEGQEIFAEDIHSVRRRGDDVVYAFRIPSVKLPQGDFIVTLKGQKGADFLKVKDYYFRVAR